jgi:hypothetical protein
MPRVSSLRLRLVAAAGAVTMVEPMASIVREIVIDADANAVWPAVKDVGAVHRRLGPGFVTNATLADGLRHVRFANGLEIDEAIVSIDDAHLRVVYDVQNRVKHHQASMQVVPGGPGQCRFIWITDVLPDDAAGRFGALMDEALPIIKRTLEADARPR